MSGSGIGWVVAANLVVWTGLFLYLLRLDSRLGRRRHRDHLEDRR